MAHAKPRKSFIRCAYVLCFRRLLLLGWRWPQLT
jgi:hypothetical protein